MKNFYKLLMLILLVIVVGVGKSYGQGDSELGWLTPRTDTVMVKLSLSTSSYDLLSTEVFSNPGTNGVFNSPDWVQPTVDVSTIDLSLASYTSYFEQFYNATYSNDEGYSYSFVFFTAPGSSSNMMDMVDLPNFTDGALPLCAGDKVYLRDLVPLQLDYRFLSFHPTGGLALQSDNSLRSLMSISGEQDADGETYIDETKVEYDTRLWTLPVMSANSGSMYITAGASTYATCTRWFTNTGSTTGQNFTLDANYSACVESTSETLNSSKSGGRWYPESVFNGNSEFNPSLLATGVHTFTYRLTSNVGSCAVEKSIDITIVGLTTSQAGDDNEWCIYSGGVEKTSVDLSTEITNFVTDANGSWSSADSNGSVNDAISGSTLALDFLPQGISSYDLRYTIDNGAGCTDYDDVTLTFNNYNNSAITIIDADENYSCEQTTFDLEINPSTGYTFEWFDAAIAGVLLETGLAYTTTTLLETTTFYIEGTHTTTGCKTQRKPITATVESNPFSTNTFVSVTDGQSCAAADLTLSVSTIRTGYEFIWYTAEIGGTELHVGDSYSTGLILETASYWVEAHHIEKGCRSPRKEVVGEILGQPTVVAGDDAVLCSTSAYVLNDGSESPTGGTFSGTGVIGTIFDPYGLDPGVYSVVYTYVTPFSCENSDVREITISEPVVLTVFDNQNHCLYVGGDKDSSYDLSLFSPSPSGGEWSTLDGSVVVDGNNLDLSGVNSNGGVTGEKIITLTYLYEYGAGGVCSESEDVTLTIRTQAASELIADDQAICGSGQITLTAENVGGNTGATIGWFDSATGGTAIETGTTLTRTIPTTTSYWVALRSNGCYGERKEVLAEVLDIEIAEAGSLVVLCLATDNYELNDGQESTFPGGIGVWTGDGVVGGTSTFDASTVDFGNTYLVTYTWYGQNGCESTDTRLIQVGAQDALLGKTDIDVALYVSNSRVNMYDLDQLNPSPVGGAFSVSYLDAGRGSFSIDEATNELNFLGINESGLSEELTVTYSVGDGNGCDSEVTTSLIIHTLSSGDFVKGEASVCGQGTVNLSMASVLTLANTDTHELTWFDTETGENVVGSGFNLTTPTLTSSKTYYVAGKELSNNLYGPRVAVTATVLDLPVVFAGADMTLCSISSETVDMMVPVTPKGGVFEGDDASLLTSGEIFDPLVFGEGTFTFVYKYTSADTGCENTDDVVITVGLNSEVAGAGIDIEECFGGASITLNPETIGGVWSSSNSLINGRINNTTSQVNITGISPGQYTLAYERVNSGGCTLEETITLDILAPPSAATADDGFICGSGTTILTASGGSNNDEYQWFNAVSDITPIHRGETYETASLTLSRAYYVNIVNESGCESEKIEVAVNVNPIPEITIGSDLTFCDDNMSYDLFQDVTKIGGDFSGTGVVDNKFVGGNGPGSYLVTYAVYDDLTHCESVATRTINVGIVPEISTDVDVIVASEPVRFDLNLTNVVSIKWDFGDGIESDEKRPYHYYYMTGKYTIRLDLVLDNGCSGNYVFEEFVNVTGSDIDVVTADFDAMDNGNLKVYPNPINGAALNVQLPFKDGTEFVVELLSLSGKRVVKKELTKTSFDTEILSSNEAAQLKNGAYILRISSNEGAFKQMITK